jgi:ethanolamine ammonia-lyase small subunit
MSELRSFPNPDGVVDDPWSSLREFTAARIALGRTGTSLPLKPALEFRLAHAMARQAVYSTLDIDTLIPELEALQLPVKLLHSEAQDRAHYLQRPDLGRRLSEASRCELQSAVTGNAGFDLAFGVADGLSATAVNRHAVPLLSHTLQALKGEGWRMAPVSLVQQGRVAIGDEIGVLLNARLVIMLIGERPGLSSTDSLGIYITYAPRVGNTDELRNCISNIRPEGLSGEAAAIKLVYLIRESFRLKLSGVNLKDNSGTIEA